MYLLTRVQIDVQRGVAKIVQFSPNPSCKTMINQMHIWNWSHLYHNVRLGFRIYGPWNEIRMRWFVSCFICIRYFLHIYIYTYIYIYIIILHVYVYIHVRLWICIITKMRQTFRKQNGEYHVAHCLLCFFGTVVDFSPPFSKMTSFKLSNVFSQYIEPYSQRQP